MMADSAAVPGFPLMVYIGLNNLDSTPELFSIRETLSGIADLADHLSSLGISNVNHLLAPLLAPLADRVHARV